MNPLDLIANRIVELLRSDSYDAEEEIKLREQVALDMCILQRVPYTGENTIGLYGSGDTEQVTQHAWRLLNVTSFKPGEVYAGVRYATDAEQETGIDGDYRQQPMRIITRRV